MLSMVDILDVHHLTPRYFFALTPPISQPFWWALKMSTLRATSCDVRFDMIDERLQESLRFGNE